MNRFAIAAAAYVAICVASSLFAQEQTILISGPKGVLSQPASLIDTANAKITIPNSKTLINNTLGAGAISKDSTVVLHILRWKDDGKLDKHNWFVYHDGVNSDEEFTGLRIYGHHKVSLVYVHLNAKAASEQEVARYTAVNDEFNALFGRFGLTNTSSKAKAEFLKCIVSGFDFVVKGPANLPMDCPKVAAAAGQQDNEDLSAEKDQFVRNRPDLINVRIAGTSPRSAGEGCGVTIGDGQSVLLDQYCVAPNYLNVGYKVVATPKLPSAISDLLKLIQPQANLHVDQLRVDSIAVWGGEQMTVSPVPSDIKMTPIQNDTPLDARTFDDEGRYFWDISVGLPIKSIKDTQYDAAGQSFTAKKVERQNLYAMFNVFPFKVDTKATGNERVTPVILIGIGITKQPLDRLLFAGGLGLGKVQFFLGTAMTKKQFPLTNGTPGDPVYRTNMTYGLNVPIRQILDKLKASK